MRRWRQTPRGGVSFPDRRRSPRPPLLGRTLTAHAPGQAGETSCSATASVSSSAAGVERDAIRQVWPACTHATMFAPSARASQ
jgi:hypothetical protein